ncbi:MAG TPA: alcohol dehydrogenase [Bacteroidetes bacterium]|nr:alcohol dehydrogenase [Bacteroidota bacterium]
MRAVLLTKFGPPEVLRFSDIPKPEPKEGEVLIRTKAIGLNFADVMARLGIYPSIPDPPFVPGIELSGIVEKVGEGVQSPREGDRVVAFSKQGGYAEYVCVPVNQTRIISSTMSFEEAAAFSVTYCTAYHALITLAHVQRGEKVLLHAAAGGVGTAAIQICKHLGVEVFATAGSTEKLEIARQQGANHLVDYRREDFAEIVRSKSGGYGVDVVMDSVGGSVFRKSWKLLAPMGRYILYGFASITGERKINKLKALWEFLSVPLVYPPSVVSKNVALMGFNLYFLSHKVQYLNHVTTELMDLYKRGILRPVIGARFPFEKIVDAHVLMQSRKSYGKIVVVV